ncbi:MAG: hypothetical protein R3E66_11375 [bacterium]
MGVAIPLGILALVNKWYIGAILVAFIAMDNYNMMRSGEGNDRPQKKAESAYMRELVSEAAEAFGSGDFREAYRLCHLARSTKETMAPKTQQRMWEILALSAVELGEIEEARGWLKRAPDTPAVVDARSKVASLT